MKLQIDAEPVVGGDQVKKDPAGTETSRHDEMPFYQVEEIVRLVHQIESVMGEAEPGDSTTTQAASKSLEAIELTHVKRQILSILSYQTS